MIALAVSDEAATYRPEMEWLAHELQLLGRRVFCVRPEAVFPLGSALCFDIDGNPEKIDVLYRFFELFDLPNIRTARFIFDAWAAGELAIAPSMRAFQEEKLALALFHHHLLQDYWAEALSGGARQLLHALIPPSWVIDPSPLPPGAVLDGPRVGGRALSDWRELAGASQKRARPHPQDQRLPRDGVGRPRRPARERLFPRGMAAGDRTGGGTRGVEPSRFTNLSEAAPARASRLRRRPRGGRRTRGGDVGGAAATMPVLFRN